MAKFGTGGGQALTFNGGSFSDSRQFLVQCSILYGTWALVAGGDPSVTVTKAFDGGTLRPMLTKSLPVVSDLVITRNFNIQRDSSMIKALNAQIMAGNSTNLQCTVSQSPLSPDMAVSTSGLPITWFGEIIGVMTAKEDATKTGSTPATVGVTISCYNIT
jgi:hypothetical protein